MHGATPVFPSDNTETCSHWSDEGSAGLTAVDGFMFLTGCRGRLYRCHSLRKKSILQLAFITDSITGNIFTLWFPVFGPKCSVIDLIFFLNRIRSKNQRNDQFSTISNSLTASPRPSPAAVLLSALTAFTNNLHRSPLEQPDTRLVHLGRRQNQMTGKKTPFCMWPCRESEAEGQS